MNVLVINGSYHTKGMTAELIESFKAGLLKAAPSASVKVVDLVDLDVKFCTGTSACGTKDGKPVGQCVLKDAMLDSLMAMLDCDVLVMASPIYWLSHTALMQKFLERCLPLLEFSSFGPKPRNPARRGKQGVVIVSTGAPFPMNMLMGFTRHAVKIMGMALRFSGCAKISVMRAGGMERDEKAKERCLKEAFALGMQIGRS
jgi:multimeric flavodoxin WrbA